MKRKDLKLLTQLRLWWLRLISRALMIFLLRASSNRFPIRLHLIQVKRVIHLLRKQQSLDTSSCLAMEAPVSMSNLKMTLWISILRTFGRRWRKSKGPRMLLKTYSMHSKNNIMINLNLIFSMLKKSLQPGVWFTWKILRPSIMWSNIERVSKEDTLSNIQLAQRRVMWSSRMKERLTTIKWRTAKPISLLRRSSLVQ